MATGDYVEIEFSGMVSFGTLLQPFTYAVHIGDNVWRIFFFEWTNYLPGLTMAWDTHLTYIGGQDTVLILFFELPFLLNVNSL